VQPPTSAIRRFNLAFDQLDSEGELFELPRVYLYVGPSMPEGDAQFAALRRPYEDAFRRFALQVRRLQSLARAPVPDREAMEQAKRCVEEAQSVYRERRDALAQFVLSREPQSSAVGSLTLRVA